MGAHSYAIKDRSAIRIALVPLFISAGNAEKWHPCYKQGRERGKSSLMLSLGTVHTCLFFLLTTNREFRFVPLKRANSYRSLVASIIISMGLVAMFLVHVPLP